MIEAPSYPMAPRNLSGPPMRFIDILITCPDREQAESIARACLEQKLAACANIGAPIESLYRWQGAIEQADEVPLLLKTRADLFERVRETVMPLHSYETPCIVATDLVATDAAYAAWLEAETTLS
jgi:periplasmic divalent cation tolerance protein